MLQICWQNTKLGKCQNYKFSQACFIFAQEHDNNFNIFNFSTMLTTIKVSLVFDTLFHTVGNLIKAFAFSCACDPYEFSV